MRAKSELCSLYSVYARQNDFMRAYSDLCVFKQFYARGGYFNANKKMAALYAATDFNLH